MIIKANICVSKIDKEKIVTGTDGKKYLDLILMEPRTPSQYGTDGFVAHDISKEERESGKKGDIIGNFKFIARDTPKAEVAKPPLKPTEFGEDKEIPF
jgi:hypothetical protein